MKSTFYPVICKHKAKAITPRTIPEYQHIFNYFEFKGKGFLLKWYMHGKRYTIPARTKGKNNKINIDIPTASH